MKKLTIRLSEETNSALGRLAQAHQRSVNKQVVWLIEQAIKNSELTPRKTPNEQVMPGVTDGGSHSGAE